MVHDQQLRTGADRSLDHRQRRVHGGHDLADLIPTAQLQPVQGAGVVGDLRNAEQSIEVGDDLV